MIFGIYICYLGNLSNIDFIRRIL